MHSAGEVAQLSDVDAAPRLIEAYIRSLTAETSFLRETGESLSPATLAG